MRRTNFYLDPEKLRALKMIAVSEDASVSDLVREAVDEIIKKRLAKTAESTPNGPIRPLATTLSDVVRRLDARRPANISADEIERDVADAVNEVRAERRAQRQRPASKAAVGNK